MTHYCKFCLSTYKQEKNYKKHLPFCEFRHKSISDDTDENYKTPSINILFGFMQEMMLKINKLEEDNLILKRHLSNKINKLDVHKWLNTNIKSDINIDVWLRNINYISGLQNVLDYGILKGISVIIDNHIQNIPIKTVEIRKNVFYVFKNNSWSNCSNADIDKYLNKIYTTLFHTFLNNPTYIELCNSDNEDEQNIYISKYNIFVGKSSDNWIQSIRKQIFKKCNTNIIG